MSDANKQLTRRWFEEVWNKKDPSAIDRMFAPNGKVYGFPTGDAVLVGPDSFKPVHRSFCGAFPDLQITVNDIVTEGDKIAVTWTAKMTHLGHHLGFPATREKITLEGASFMTALNGQLVHGRNYMEMEALMDRLKATAQAAPPSAPAAL